MFKGERTVLTQKVGTRSVYLVPEEDSIDVYFQKKGTPWIFAYGTPMHGEDLDEFDPDDLFITAWGYFEIHEEDMFQ